MKLIRLSLALIFNIVILSAIIYFSWNWAISDIFNLSKITFLQAVAIRFVLRFFANVINPKNIYEDKVSYNDEINKDNLHEKLDYYIKETENVIKLSLIYFLYCFFVLLFIHSLMK
jgi:hypothetical protein